MTHRAFLAHNEAMTDKPTHERYSIPHDPDLFSDTWAEDSDCPNCKASLPAGASSCPTCHQWIGECGHACGGCPSPICIGGDRAAAKRGRP
ncbi:MAG: hypothetical protein HGB10_07910 [Coriobacteriia bacterium]|nr:hypothetical protein [Coriobacteriia bacterium]